MKRFGMPHVAAGMLLSVAMSFGSTAAWAEGYPERPITVVVPFGPGGTTDLTARAFQKAIADDNLLPQPLVVVNVTGGAVGSVGSRQVLDSKPDGYTFLLHHIGMMSAGAVGTQDFSYKDFDPVAGTTDFCHVIAVAEDAPWDSLTELLEAAKAEPDSILYGVNLGGTLHVSGLMAENLMDGAKFRFIQVGGEAENVTAIKGGIVQASTLSTGTFNRYKMEGLKALVDLAPEREAGVEDVPTSHEQGYNLDFCVQHWWWAPKGTPEEVKAAFAEALRKAMDNPELREFFENRATALTFDTGEEFAKKLDATYEGIAAVAERVTEK